MDPLSELAERASRLRIAIESNTSDTLLFNDFRGFIYGSRDSVNTSRSVKKEIVENLLVILSSGRLCSANLIVVATSYCRIICDLEQEPEKIFQHFLFLLKEEENQEFKVFICYGIFQVDCWKTLCKDTEVLLEEIFKIILRSCCELTSTCHFAFKVLSSLLGKIHQLYPDGSGISEENFKGTLEIVLSNWENPLNGVRQQNTEVFKKLLLFSDQLWKGILTKARNGGEAFKRAQVHAKHQCLIKLVVSELSWSMKSKHFLLTAIIEESNVLQILTEHKDDIVTGLTESLSIPYLVSAGTDLYVALLEHLSFEEWQCWFFQAVTNIISQQSLSLDIENIFNYWIQKTFKKFPSILEDLIEIPSINPLALITLHKIGRKLGSPLSQWEVLDKTMIRVALEDYSTKVRTQAFSLVCTSSKTSVLPSNDEFDLVQQFLKQNVNSDDTALRQALLNYFTDFVIRIKESLLYIIKDNKKFFYESFSNNSKCFIFLDWLHSFLLFNLEEKCNYQRKTTSIKLYSIILSFFGEESTNGSSSIRKSNKGHLNLKNNKYFSWEYKFESELFRRALVNCLFNEDNNIRSCSANILVSYFVITHNSNIEELKTLFGKATALCSDQIFYKAESGALITQVLVNWAYRSSSMEFRKVIDNGSDNFYSHLLSNAEEQFFHLQEDLLRAAVEGSFLYGTLQALKLMLVDSTIPELSFNERNQERLIILLEKVAGHFIAVLSSESDTVSGYAPSFGEMGMAIAAVVDSSSLKSSVVTVDITDDTSPELQLTPAQQLVLSCIWLNLKECCELSSTLVNRALNVRDIRRCAAVVMSVLCKCRHKGAIESAGLALFHITSRLTKSNSQELMNIPDEWLRGFFEMLIGTSAATVSRRSAGLAILVHRLITGDFRPRKPLLHVCVSRLLSVVRDAIVLNQEALVDLPQSQALHFLRTLVQESSLREHMACYTLSISLVALTNLASPVWTIRNAALQLFGALVPKLVGQKPNPKQGRGNHHLAFEELFFHAKPLVEMILNEFTLATCSNSTILHSKLMPLLTLVTNLTLGLHTVLAYGMSDIVQQFQQCFKSLFKSRIFSVRKLSAKAHALFATACTLIDMIKERLVELNNHIEGKKSCILSENELHGYMLNLVHLFGRFEEEKTGMTVLLKREQELYLLVESFSHNFLLSNCSYFTKSLIFELKFPKPCVQSLTMSFEDSSKQSLGFSHFIHKQLFSAVVIMNEKEVEEIVDFCLLNNSSYDVQISCLKALRQYIRTKNDLSSNTSKKLLSLLKEFLLCTKHNTMHQTNRKQIIYKNHLFIPLLFEIMLHIFERVTLQYSDQFCCPELLFYCVDLISSDQTCIPATHLLPVTSALLSTNNDINVDFLLKVVILIKARTHSDIHEDIKLSTAKAMTFLVEILRSGKMQDNKCGELLWAACVDLLQDEVTEVRIEASKFVSRLTSETHRVKNPFVSLDLLFQSHCIVQFMNLEKAVDCLWEKMLCTTEKDLSTTGVFNPFDHGVKNIYAEESVISHLSYCCLLDLINRENCVHKILKQLCDETFDSKISDTTWGYTREIQKRCLAF